MEARTTVARARRLIATAYARPQIQTPRRTKSYAVPGPAFDAAVVVTFAVLAIGCLL